MANINLEESYTQVVFPNTPIDQAGAQAHYDNGDSVLNFIGGFEKPISFLDSTVPEGFLNSEILDNGELRQKTWREYCLYKESLDGTKVLFSYLHVYANGYRPRLPENLESVQWRLWWELSPMLTRSDFYDLYKSSVYTDQTP